jgi:hypothetical protein
MGFNPAFKGLKPKLYSDFLKPFIVFGIHLQQTLFGFHETVFSVTVCYMTRRVQKETELFK